MILVSKYKNLNPQQVKKLLLIGYTLYLLTALFAVGLGVVNEAWGNWSIISNLLNILYYSVYAITALIILLTLRMDSLSQGKSRFLWRGNLVALILLFPVVPFIWSLFSFIIIASLTMRLH